MLIKIVTPPLLSNKFSIKLIIGLFVAVFTFVWNCAFAFCPPDSHCSNEFLFNYRLSTCSAEFLDEKGEDTVVFIPNAFTPNGDHLNDLFVPSFLPDIFIFDYQIQVLNRWGELVFKSNDPIEGWNGLYDNMPVISGTYLWKIDMRYKNESDNIAKQSITGRLDLLR